MTAVAATPIGTAVPHTRVGFGHLMTSEWTKIRSVRSTIWALVLLFVLTVGFTTLITGLTAAQWSDTDLSDRQSVADDTVSFILGAGFQLSQLTICVLGVMVIASEYSTGMIRASLLAVPKRLPMLYAKSAVFAMLVFVVGLLSRSRRSSSARRSCTATQRWLSATPVCSGPSSAPRCTSPCSGCSRSRSARSCATPEPASRAWSASSSCFPRWHSCFPAA